MSVTPKFFSEHQLPITLEVTTAALLDAMETDEGRSFARGLTLGKACRLAWDLEKVKAGFTITYDLSGFADRLVESAHVDGSTTAIGLRPAWEHVVGLGSLSGTGSGSFPSPEPDNLTDAAWNFSWAIRNIFFVEDEGNYAIELAVSLDIAFSFRNYFPPDPPDPEDPDAGYFWINLHFYYSTDPTTGGYDTSSYVSIEFPGIDGAFKLYHKWSGEPPGAFPPPSDILSVSTLEYFTYE